MAAALVFYLLAALAVTGAVLVVRLRNPMYGAMGLLLSFLAVAGLFVLRHAEFLAAVQIFVYGGGIMVLFLFVIMLVNLHQLQEVHLFRGSPLFSVLLALLLAGTLAYIFVAEVEFPPVDEAAVVRNFQEVDLGGEAQLLGNSEAVAWTLYQEYLLPFEIASLFLLVAMVGAVVLGRRL